MMNQNNCVDLAISYTEVTTAIIHLLHNHGKDLCIKDVSNWHRLAK